jgi:hypothetical protein
MEVDAVASKPNVGLSLEKSQPNQVSFNVWSLYFFYKIVICFVIFLSLMNFWTRLHGLEV